MSDCKAIKRYGEHLNTIYYRRPWYRLWRKTYVLACWYCDMEIEEP